MRIVDATIEDGKMCGQLLNFLKVAKLPDGMSVNDTLALGQTMAWFNEFVKALATELSAKRSGTSQAPAVSPSVPLLPIKKKELEKYKKKGKK